MSCHIVPHPRQPLSGFTLIEVLLSLALAVLVLTVIGTAIDLDLRLLQSSRTDVEQCRLARAVLRQIGDDLRCAVRYVAPSSTAVVNTFAAPGIYGDSTQIQIDMSRTPKPSAGSMTTDILDSPAAPTGDVRSVTYMLVPGLMDGSIDSSGGLVRYETDWASAATAASDGRLATELMGQTPIAPEVTALQFSYWDGAEWVAEWDSQEREGLPQAVEAAITVVRPRADGEIPAASSSLDSTGDDSARTYRLRVNVPTAISGTNSS